MSDEEPTGKKSVSFGDAVDLENGNSKQLSEESATAETHSLPPKSTDDGDSFDPLNMKKKKKKKAATDAVEAGEETAKEVQEANGDATFDPGMKRKKKKKEITEEDDVAPAVEGEGGFDAALMKKKKKKKVTTGESAFEKELAKLNLEGKKEEEEEPEEPAVEQTQEELEKEISEGTGPWAQEVTTQLKYTQLLKRFYITLYEDHPELSGDGRLKGYKIPPPQVVREGNKKSIFVNLPEIARKMKRNPDHIIQFLFAELGTNGSVDGSGRLVIKGRFQQKQLESVLRRYIVEYLTCGTCKSPNTNLVKENRLFFVNCNVCGSRKSVQAIKTGFQAAIGKRKKIQG